MAQKRQEKPYGWEEVFSFDRLKRTMVGRVLESVEAMCEGSEPVTPEQINQVIKDEWEDVKRAVRSSPAARESFRKYLEKTVSEKVAGLIEQDKAELESLGVIERGL